MRIFSSRLWVVTQELALCVMLFAVCQAVYAQQPMRIPRIGYLVSSTTSTRQQAFQRGMRELGYVEGKNIVIERRDAEENANRLHALAAELVHLKVEVIVTAGGITTRAAKEATNMIPIVMAQDTDPVANGFVASLGQPGGNITGLATLSPQISGKRLEILKETVPTLTHMAIMGTSANPGNAQSLRETELAAEALKVQVRYLDIVSSKDIAPAFRAATKDRADAVLVLNSPVAISYRKQVVDLAVKGGLPVIYPQSEYVEDGGLMVYGVSYTELSRRAATYVDRILKGAKPADLPIEQPKKFEFIINLKAANQIGLTIPPNVLARADRVIK
jgi:ABC-type uncharacterized transport system substrate-binding protein